MSQAHAEVAHVKPKLTAPSEGAVFDNYPRTAVFSWERVPRASKYRIEVQCEIKDADTGQASWIGCAILFSAESQVKLDTFPGAQRGRWRVIGMDAKGATGQSSEWRTFRFTK
jgi:hypothetical protein